MPRVLQTTLTKLAKNASLLFVNFVGLWAFVEVLTYFEVIKIDDNNNKNVLFILFLVFTILFYLIGILYQRFINKIDSEILVLKIKLKKEIASISRTVDLISNNNNYYKLLLIEWRLEHEREKFDRIFGGEWTIRDLSSYEYFRYIFLKVMGRLQKNDEYLTLSNIEFWNTKKGEIHSFLDENLAAVNLRGVVIKRVILIDKRWLESPDNYSDRIELLCRINQIIMARFTKIHKNQNQLKLDYYVSKNYDEDAKPPVPYAIVLNESRKNYMTILPDFIVERSTGGYSSLKFNFYKNPTTKDFETHLSRFRYIYSIEQEKYDVYNMEEYLKENFSEIYNEVQKEI